MLKFRPSEPVRLEIDGTTLIFRDIGEDEWAAFVRQHNVVTQDVLDRARDAGGEDGIYSRVYLQLTPEKRREWDDLDALFFAGCWIGAEGMDPDGVQFGDMDQAMRMEVYRDLQGVEAFRKFWPIYYRGKKKVSLQSDLSGVSSDGASNNA